VRRTIFKLKKNPNDRDQQHGSDPDRSDLEVDCTVSVEYRSVHCIWPVISALTFEVTPAIGVLALPKAGNLKREGDISPLSTT